MFQRRFSILYFLNRCLFCSISLTAYIKGVVKLAEYDELTKDVNIYWVIFTQTLIKRL